MFSLLPGVAFAVETAAALAGVRAGMVSRALTTLAQAGLIVRTMPPGRFRLNEAFRSHVGDARTSGDDEALVRLVSWYLHTCDWAQFTLAPSDAWDPKCDNPTEVTPKSFELPEEALRWWQEERVTIVSVVRAASEARLHGLVWRLAGVLWAIYAQWNAYEDWEEVAKIGVASAEADGDRAGQALALESLGELYVQTGRLEEGEASHLTALEIRRRQGDRFGEASSLNALGLLELRRRRFRTACARFDESTDIFVDLGMPRWTAVAATNGAEAMIELGQTAEAAQVLSEMVEVFADEGDRSSEGKALALLSRALRSSGDLTDARARIDAALEIAAAAGNPMWRGYWLLELGRVQGAAWQYPDALDSFERSFAIHRELGNRSREALALDGAGEVHLELQMYAEASQLYRMAEAVHREQGDRWPQALSLCGMARAQFAMKHFQESRISWEKALTALAVFNDPPASKLREEVIREVSYFRHIMGEFHEV
ncbi:tetratricopeptide repeat protein [Acrocarpospora sp. B8E8]|uniref:tetratricopeptide repeat protein n=1 Tax=Acrocarpospora sp. B8E8 TaxID=3153572 RepID=UPI00325D7F99